MHVLFVWSKTHSLLGIISYKKLLEEEKERGKKRAGSSCLTNIPWPNQEARAYNVKP